jgi:O-antigen ligase
MTFRSPLPEMLAAVLMAGVLITWAPGYWPVGVLYASIFLSALAIAISALLRPGAWLAPLPQSSLYIPLSLIAIWGPMQLGFHTTVYRHATWTSSLYWLTNLVVFLLAAILLQHPGARARFLSALMYFGCGLVILSILQSYTSPNKVFWLFESNYRVIGPFIYKNQFAAFVELIMPIALYRMLTDRKNSVVYAFLSATMFAAVVASASRTGTALLALEVLLILAAGWRKKMVSTRVSVLLLVQVMVLLAVCVGVVGWQDLEKQFQDETSRNLRYKLLTSTLSMIRDYPGLGVGLGNWTAVYPAYSLFDNGVYANAAHNDWAQWAAEGGVPFAILMGWILFGAMRSAWQYPWSVGVASVLIHSFIDYPAREPVIGAILFCLAGATAAASAKPVEIRVFSMKRVGKPVR